VAEVDAAGGAPTPQQQLPLAIRLRDDATLDNFLVLPAAAPLLAVLRGQLAPAGEPVIYLHGPSGSGKSHLLQACCHTIGADSLYLPLRELCGYAPDQVLQNLESLARVCLDDLQVVAGNAAWERALFHLLNRARAGGCRVVVAAAAGPGNLGVQLPDLQSRLAWGGVYGLPRCGDEEKAAILCFRAARRGLELAPAVADYVVSRAGRSPDALLAILERLDHASLAQQRPLSKPFVKQVMDW